MGVTQSRPLLFREKPAARPMIIAELFPYANLLYDILTVSAL